MRAMNNEIIIRLRSPEGQNRLTIRAGDTFGEFILAVSKQMNYPIKDMMLLTDDNKPLSVFDKKKIYDIPYFKDGAIVKVESKAPKLNKRESHGVGVAQVEKSVLSSKCNHPPGGKCLNCLSSTSKEGKQNTEQKKQQNLGCNHGPGGKCLNCTTVDEKSNDTKMKWLCQHGPNAKCCHCLDKQYISDAAHISFDHFLEQRKLKCKGVHPSDVKCNNCLPPSEIRYEVDRTCKYHEPYPKAMCNKCIPPNVVIKRQEYRHVDYVQFMNVDQISSFIKFWVQKKHMAEQRVGFLYGYYAEDPHYKGGIRVIVEAIYQPKQTGTYSSFEILQSAAEISKVDTIAASLSLERIGWIFTENNHDTVMTESQIRMAARLQEEYNVAHSSGYPISNFITVILRNDEKNQGNVKPEVYMISDQGQALEKYNLLDESESRKMMKVKVPRTPNEALPSFIVAGKNATEFEPEFLLVKIAHGSSNSNKFAILKKAKFPAKHQQGATTKDFKNHLMENKKKPSHIKYGDFNFLIYLADVLDIQTAVSIAQNVERETPVAEAIDDLIEHKADL